MTSQELRQKYLDFFVKKGHKVIPSAPLVPENDPTTLFTSSGMQPLIPYLLGKTHPEGKRLANSQSCFRAQDIEEVGNNRHTTFFEMLGNWSLGDYFKREQLSWFWEFLTHQLQLDPNKLYVSYFQGNAQIPEDIETKTIWQELGIPQDHIFAYGVSKNWWSRCGTPEQMPAGEIGGPDSEVFYEFIEIEHNPKFGEKCHPNCDCGRFLEIGNSVFIQYQKQEDGSLKELPDKNVDFGGGLERLVAAALDNPDIFQTDLFTKTIKEIESLTNKKYIPQFQRQIRVIADHMRAAVAIIESGITPSNHLQGYILRRLLRRSVIKLYQLNKDLSLSGALLNVSYSYATEFDQEQGWKFEEIIENEVDRFERTLDKGLRIIEKLQHIDGKIAFDLYQTYGFPLELTTELAEEKGVKINKQEFQQEFEKHKELSRTASAGMFKGGLGEQSETTTKYHTATHLLHAALRQVLGNHVQQRGSNITSERLRFDFSHPDKLAAEQLKQVENLVNQKIKENLAVTSEVMDKEKALQSGALGFFGAKYGDKVTVYSINSFSREICGGPHIEHTFQLGNFHITKEESAGTGTRRIYATLSEF